MFKKWMLSIKAMVLCLSLVLATGCGQQTEGLPQIDGVVGPIFNVVDGKVQITFKFLNLYGDFGLGIPVPRTKNSYASFSPNAVDGGTVLEISLDVADLQSISVGVGDGNYLPDGRPIPGVPGGRLDNSLRIDTEWHDVSFYYHKQLFGIWLPVGFDTNRISAYWNIAMSGKRVGFLGLVGNDEQRGFSAGAVLLLNLDALKDKQLQQIIKMSKQNKHMVY